MENRLSKPFLITGLPRSRTAWFSVAMRGRFSNCLHEPTADTQSLGGLYAMWSDPRWEYMGVSDSSLGYQLGRILDDKGPRTLIIERPVAEVIGSLTKLLRYEVATWRNEFEALQDELLKYKGHPLVRWVEYRELQDPATLIKAADWLIPNHGVQALALQHLNIQTNIVYAQAVARRAHSMWHMQRTRNYPLNIAGSNDRSAG